MSMVISVLLPLNCHVEYLTPSEVPTFAQRHSTVGSTLTVATSTNTTGATDDSAVGVDIKTGDNLLSSAALKPTAETLSSSLSSSSAPSRGSNTSNLDGGVWSNSINGIIVLTRWDPAVSDNELVFSHSDTVARRPGSVSCYPASLLRIPVLPPSPSTQVQILLDMSKIFSVTMLLQNAPKGPNSMSIGIAKEGSFKSHGSDGFGLSAHSWGLIESRATGEGKIYANRQPVGSFRKMKDNDHFVVVYDRNLGKAWLIIYTTSTGSSRRRSPSRSSSSSSSLEQVTMNTIELCQEFTLHPPGQPMSVVIGATYCNDHEMRILSVPPPDFNSQPLTSSSAPSSSSSSLQQQSSTENEENVLLLLPGLPTHSAAAAKHTSLTTAAAAKRNINSNVLNVTTVPSSVVADPTPVSEDPFYAPLLQWDVSQSDPALRFLRHNSSAHRPGNVSCYPAALVSVPRNCRSCLTAVLDNCPFANNTMSFGIALKGFPKSGQQALGERSDSWGIFNNRSEPCVDEPSKIYESGVPVATFRRLRLGDVLQICVDSSTSDTTDSRGTAELRVNDTEFRYTFARLNMNKDYVVGATFCNNHSLLIINHTNIAQYLNPSSSRSRSGAGAVTNDTTAAAAVSTAGVVTDATTGNVTSGSAIQTSQAEKSNTSNSSASSSQLLPYAQYLERTSVLAALPSCHTPPSTSASLLSKKTALISSSSSLYDSVHESVKERMHVIRRYSRETEKMMKELKFSSLSATKQIKAINCALQGSLLPPELISLSTVTAILNLLQTDRYPNFSTTFTSTNHNNDNNKQDSVSSSTPSQVKLQQQRLSAQDLQTLIQSNWREYIPGHILYKQVIPHCMSRASQCVHLLPASKVTKSIGGSDTHQVRVRVDGAVGYTIQLLQPLIIPATHVLRITACVYPYNPALIRASVSARRVYMEEKQMQRSKAVMESKKTTTGGGDSGEDGDNEYDDDEDEAGNVFLKREVLCELYGCGSNKYMAMNQATNSTSDMSGSVIIQKQSAAVCHSILQASATHLHNYTPVSYDSSSDATHGGVSAASSTIASETQASSNNTASSNTMKAGKSVRAAGATTSVTSDCVFGVGDSVVRNFSCSRSRRITNGNTNMRGEIGDVYHIVGPVSSGSSSSSSSNGDDDVSHIGAMGDEADAVAGVTSVSQSGGDNLPSRNAHHHKYYHDVHVRWRDSNSRQVFKVYDTVAGTGDSLDNDVVAGNTSEILLWKKNPLAHLSVTPSPIINRTTNISNKASSELMTTMLWTPVLTKEIEFSLEPFDRCCPDSQSESSDDTGSNNSTIIDNDDCTVRFLVTPVLTVSSVIHSPRHYQTLQRVVNTYNLWGSSLGLCIGGERANNGGNNENNTRSINNISNVVKDSSSSSSSIGVNTVNNTTAAIRDESTFNSSSTVIASASAAVSNHHHKSRRAAKNRRDKIDAELVGLIERVVLKQRQQAVAAGERGSGSVTVTVPDSWERLAVSAEDAVHFPLLSLALTDESHWLQQYCCTTAKSTSVSLPIASSLSSSSSMQQLSVSDTNANNMRAARNNGGDNDNGARELLQGFEQLLNEEQQEISSSSSSSSSSTSHTSSMMNSDILAHRYTLIRLLNQELSSCLDLINFNSISNNILTSTASNNNNISSSSLSHVKTATIAELLSRHRGYIYSWVKEAFIARLINGSYTDPTAAAGGSNTASGSGGSKFELILSRSRAAKYTAQREVDSSGRWSVFGQAFRRIHGMPASALRRTGQLWDTVFAGERSHDSGGPYREAWSAIIADLVSPVPILPLLKPCPNNEGKVGLNQETYLLNPDCIHNTTQLEMLSFLGKLMGSAARAHNYLDLYLAPLVWKLLVRQPLTMEDIREVDVNAANQVFWLRQRLQGGGGAGEQQKPLTEEVFYAHDLHYSVMSKGGSVIELHPGGSTEAVQWGDDIDRYCDELEFYYLQRECQPVAEAVRAGLITQLPNAMLNILRWYELEEMVCGRPDVDIDLLQSTVEYERGCSASDKHVLWLWELLRHEFSAEDKKAFIRFVWGRSRLPLTKAGFTQPFKIQGFARSTSSSSSHGNNNDSYLPVSHTCFFSVELPRYSSKEHLKKKLLYAIHNCTAIDADDTGAGMRAAALGIEM